MSANACGQTRGLAHFAQLPGDFLRPRHCPIAHLMNSHTVGGGCGGGGGIDTRPRRIALELRLQIALHLGEGFNSYTQRDDLGAKGEPPPLVLS